MKWGMLVQTAHTIQVNSILAFYLEFMTVMFTHFQILTEIMAIFRILS